MGRRWIILLMAVGMSCAAPRNVNREEGEGNARDLGEKERMQIQYAFAEATHRKIFGELDQAIILYKECLKLDPEHAASMYELSNIYNYLGEKKMAVQYAENALENEPENKWYGMHLAGLYHQEGDVEKAIEVYREMAERKPGEIDIKYNLATLYAREEKYNESLDIFDELERSMGISEMVNMAKYNIYMKLGKQQMAANELKKLITVFPEEIKYRGLLAELYDEMGEDEKAVMAYQELFKIDPENGLAQMSVSSYYRRNGEYQKSLEWLGKAVRNPEIELDDKIQAILFYINQEEVMEKVSQEMDEIIETLTGEYPEENNAMAIAADYYIKTNNADKARKYLERMTEINPENYGVWEQWIFLENTQENYQNMVRVANKALKLFPEMPNLYLYITIGYYEIRDYENMVRYGEKGLIYSDKNEEIRKELYALLGEGYHAMGENEISDDAFENALSIDPEDVMVLNNYAYYLSERGKQLEKALEMSQKCLKMEPENYTYLDTYAWILFKMGKSEDALRYIRKSMEKGGGKDPEILEHYGDILYKAGMIAEAVNAWEKSVDMGNDKEEILEKIEEVKGK